MFSSSETDITSSSSSSDDEYRLFCASHMRSEKPKVKDFVSRTVHSYTDAQVRNANSLV